MKVDLLGKWSTREEAKKWPEGIAVVARRLDLSVKDYGGVDLETYFRPDQIDLRYTGKTAFIRLSPHQEGEENARKRKR